MSTTLYTISDAIRAVRAHASAHYEKDGWDYVVEAYDDKDLASIIGDARTDALAIRRVGEIVGIHHDRRMGAINAGL